MLLFKTEIQTLIDNITSIKTENVNENRFKWEHFNLNGISSLRVHNPIYHTFSSVRNFSTLDSFSSKCYLRRSQINGKLALHLNSVKLNKLYAVNRNQNLIGHVNKVPSFTICVKRYMQKLWWIWRPCLHF